MAFTIEGKGFIAKAIYLNAKLKSPSTNNLILSDVSTPTCDIFSSDVLLFFVIEYCVLAYLAERLSIKKLSLGDFLL